MNTEYGRGFCDGYSAMKATVLDVINQEQVLPEPLPFFLRLRIMLFPQRYMRLTVFATKRNIFDKIKK
jgi:hypothetical protein